MKPFMFFTSNHQFHDTKYGTILRIIATNSLKFENFEDIL